MFSAWSSKSAITPSISTKIVLGRGLVDLVSFEVRFFSIFRVSKVNKWNQSYFDSTRKQIQKESQKS